jgi:hypothetical protein
MLTTPECICSTLQVARPPDAYVGRHRVPVTPVPTTSPDVALNQHRLPRRRSVERWRRGNGGETAA